MQNERQSPFEKFCKKHLEHPELPELINAEREEDQPRRKQLYLQLTRDDWGGYLQEMTAGDISRITSALFRYLSKVDGRRPRVQTFPCATPPLDTEGRRVLTGSGKCRVLADTLKSA